MTRPETAPPAPRLIRAAAFAPPQRRRAPRLPPLPWRATLVGAALLLWACAAWFMFTARAVTVTITPAEATLALGHPLAPRVGRHWLLRPGAHRVRASAAGYREFDGSLVVGSAANQSLTLALTRLPGHLRLALTPANVLGEALVDEQPAGVVPGTLRELEAGPRAVEVRVPRYRPWLGTVEIEGKGIEQPLDVVLQPAWADYRIDAQPSGAMLSIDGQAIGTTPLRGELLEGRRLLRLDKPGYQPWQQVLKVKAGTAVQLGTVVLREADGELALHSTPPGASVTLDQAYVGRTPLRVALAPGKPHRLRLMAEGYAALEREVQVAAAARDELALTLEPELAEVEFETTPATAELLVDGVPRGAASQRLTLPTRAHEITIRARGHATWQSAVVPRKGVLKRLRVRLKTIAEAGAGRAAARGATSSSAPVAGASRGDTRPADTTVTTSLGQVLKLFTGGRARLGAPRGEARRRADEIERPVLLQRAFYLGIREVSNGEFRRFLATHHVAPHGHARLDDYRQPVAELDWRLAAQYCNWLSRRDGLPPFYQIRYGSVLGVNPAATGYRLPTEAEWEWAAGSGAGGERRGYPWGNAWPPAPGSGNYADQSAAGLVEQVLRGFDDGYAAAAPVASFAPDARGLYDLGGNVAEWMHDYYDPAPAATQTVDPLGPPAGTAHVIKGASWTRATQATLRAAYRDAGERGRSDVGFRLARYAH